jgi:tetratricopeptide (TPR) repeat protein
MNSSGVNHNMYVPTLLAMTLIFCNLQLGAQNPKEPGARRPKIETAEDNIGAAPGAARPRTAGEEVKPILKPAGKGSNPVSKVMKRPQPQPMAQTAKADEPGASLPRVDSKVVTPDAASDSASRAVAPKGVEQPRRSTPAPAVSGGPVQSGPSAACECALSALLPLSWPVILPALTAPEPSADTIISTFLDQKQATEVTEKEWQAVLSQDNAALLKQPGNRYLKARVLFAQGQIAYLRGDLTKAFASYDEAIRVMPDSLLGHLGVGQIYLARGLASEAIESFQNVIRINPKLARAYKSLGDAYSRSERSKEAVKMYLRAQELGYTGADLTTLLKRNQAQILIGEHRWQQAVSKLEAIAENSTSADVYLTIGQCYEELNQMLSAAQAYTRATQLDRQLAVAHLRLGNLLLRQHEFQAAAAALERAIMLDPSGARIDLQRARNNLRQARKRLPSKKRPDHGD